MNRFWEWLTIARTVQTLGGGARYVTGQAINNVLILTTSGGRGHRITNETVMRYCHDIFLNGTSMAVGNRRYVGALLKEYLELP